MELPRNPTARRGPDTSPDRAKLNAQPRVKPFRKVQIIYYLCRNGQLEHPHFMELTHLPNQNIRLKDVIQRLTVLRGRGMPSLYSWSCKRIYKNGYVWNDLAEDDVIHPAEGAEYVLKGSEIVTRSTVETTRRQPASPRPTQLRNLHHGQESEAEEDTPNSTCSRGVSTDTTVEGSPSSSSDEELHKKHEVSNGSRLEEGELQRRVPSMVLRFIACGSSAAGFDFVGKTPARELTVSNSSGRMEEECFSGSMAAVEMAAEGNVRGLGPLIKRSTSSDEDRSNHYSSRLSEAVEEEGEERSVRGKCMPSRNWKRSSACKK